MQRLFHFVLLLILGICLSPAHAQQTATTVFSAGKDGYHSYRIPAIIIAKNGDLLAFAEGRIDSWKDKSRTHLVLRRSADMGKTWQPMQIIAQDGTNAYMDPCPVVDRSNGTIYLFSSKWPRASKSAEQNKLIMLVSRDHGKTWTEQDLTASTKPAENNLVGFGPGSGIQITKGKFAGRLMIPSRQQLPNKSMKDIMIYSDDHGKTWICAPPAPGGGEGQVAEGPKGELYLNLRRSAMRQSTISKDGGITWSPLKKEPALLAPERGCHGSVLGFRGKLIYTGPQGIQGTKPTDPNDNRSHLSLYTSNDMGETWSAPKLLSDKASGYSCMAPLPNGKIAVFYEAGDTPGFTRSRARSTGWMRLDLIITPPTAPTAPKK